MVKRNYELPEKVADAIEDFSADHGIAKQRVMAAGAIMVCQLGSADRELLLSNYAAWLNGQAIDMLPDTIAVDPQIAGVLRRGGKLPPMVPLRDLVHALLLHASSFSHAQWAELCSNLDRFLRPAAAAVGSHPVESSGQKTEVLASPEEIARRIAARQGKSPKRRQRDAG